MEKYFDLGRAYYTYLKSSTNKDQCTVSVICDDIDIKHNIMDGLLFAGAYIYDGYQENTDGSITVCDGNISVDISHILGNLITVIFDYQILRKPLKILSL